jgi:DNA-binding NarL/FixJ family response regulator
MVRVIIADDHPVVRAGLKMILERDPAIKVVEEVSDGEALLKSVRKTKYDIALMDLSMPGRNWLDVIKELKEMRPSMPILVVSMHNEEEYIIRALRAGAAGYLTKDSVTDELMAATKKVLRGRRYVSPEIAEKLVDLLDTNTDQAFHKKLTDREYQVFLMIAGGKKTKDIADELFLSTNTISTYRARILEKLNLKSTADIIHYAIKHQLVSQ